MSHPLLRYPKINVNSGVTATGTNQATAAPVKGGFTVVTGADGTVGVVLPPASEGVLVILKGVTNNVLKVYPAGSDTINALSASSAMSLASGLIPAIFITDGGTAWYTIPLLPS